MTAARAKIVDVSVTRFYHCISRCVRRAYLCGEGLEHRKKWIEKRLEFLVECFAVSVAGFAVMDNHLHLLVRLDPDAANDWSEEEVARRWLTLCPPGGEVEDQIADLICQPRKIAEYRARLANIGWFMKLLKEPLARMANREDECTGAFWEGRFKSIAILDEEALLATCAYIDLNPVAAGVATTPETSPHTSVGQRIEHFRRKGKLEVLQAAKQGALQASRAAGNTEQDHWLIPMDDRRSTAQREREGLLSGFSLGSYLQLVDFTSRLYRKGKARISAAAKGILDRIGSCFELWSDRMKRMLKSKKLHGRYFAGRPEVLKELTSKKQARHLANLSPQ